MANNFGRNWGLISWNSKALKMAHHEGVGLQNRDFPSSKSQRTINISRSISHFFREYLPVTVAKKFGGN